jgi:hypothetical protein
MGLAIHETWHEVGPYRICTTLVSKLLVDWYDQGSNNYLSNNLFSASI